jgi:hypothetical protein
VSVLIFLYISALVFSVLIGVLLLFFLVRNRPAPGVRSLSFLILAAIVWSGAYALELLSPTLAAMTFWAKVQYFGIATLPLAWLSFAMKYTGDRDWLERPPWQQALFGAVPLVTLMLVWTNELHGLVWQDLRLKDLGPIQIIGIEHGPWFWVYIAYSYCLVLWGSVRLIVGLLGSVRLHRG